MIRSIEIENFRGIQSGKLDDLTPLTILVGPNGCGKSTILDALLIGARPAPGEAIGHVVRRRLGVSRGARWLFWRAALQNTPQIRLTTYEDVVRQCQLMVDQSPSENINQTTLSCLVYEGTSSSTSEHGRAKIEFQIGNEYAYSGFASPLRGVTNIRLVESQAYEFQKPLHELYTEALEQGRRKEVREIIAAVVPGLDNVELGSEGETPIVYLVFPDYGIPVAMAGDGVQTLLRLSLELASRPGGVVLLEEPEVHEHPGAIRQTARAILAAVRRDIQVVLSTHSLELIDALLYETQGDKELNKLSVFGLKLDEGCLKSYHLDGHQVAIARTEIEDDLR